MIYDVLMYTYLRIYIHIFNIYTEKQVEILVKFATLFLKIWKKEICIFPSFSNISLSTVLYIQINNFRPTCTYCVEI